MANSQALCTSFKGQLFNGIHAFGTSVVRAATTPDTFMAALYLVTATVNSTTTVYSSTGEVTGTNYVAGGTAVAWIAPSTSGTTAFSTLSASIVYTTVTLSTAFDAVLIYNATQGNKAVSVHTFGSQTVTAGTFTITMPVNNSSTALIRIV